MVSKCKRKIWSDIKNKYSDCQKSEGKKEKETKVCDRHIWIIKIQNNKLARNHKCTWQNIFVILSNDII